MISECQPEPSPQTSIFKTQQKQKPKPVKPTPDESPGDHEDTEGLDKPAKKVEVESVYDDCGDDVSTIAGTDIYTCFDEESESSNDDVDLFNEEFYAWALTGSTTCAAEPLHERPHSLRFASMTEAYTAIGNDPMYQGQHDICELFGGEAGTTRICIRRGLKTGPSFDINIGIDLTSAAEQALLWRYVIKHQPRVIIAGPPCTSFGPWARHSRVKAYETWRKNRIIGETLANLTAKLCLYQLTRGLHFIVENPEQSDLWKLPLFTTLLGDARVVQAILDQCQVGLVDPEGSPTKKPTRFIASHINLIRRLRLRCNGEHIHALLAGNVCGYSRCKYAQVWPRRLVELLAAGIVETLKSTSLYPAAIRKPKQPAATCPGCRAHARRNDPRHDRGPNCGFQFDESVIWDCPACKSNKPSTHSGHSFDDSCQWTDAPTRRRGTQSAPSTLRDPKIPSHQAPAISPSGAELAVPPPVRSVNLQLQWTPLTNLEVITELDQCRNRDGWHKVTDGAALVQANGRSLKSCEPRFEVGAYRWRSTYGLFPESTHPAGSWWQLEDKAKYTEPEYDMNLPIGYAVPILVQIFHKEVEAARPIENIIRNAQSSVSNVGLPAAATNPLRSLMEQWDEEELQAPAEAAENGAELLPPAVNPQPPIGAEPDIDIQPEWSSFDLGNSLRALRSDNIGHQNKALRRLHLRWFHASTARMTGLLQAAGVSAAVIQRISATVDSCKICRMWKAPGRKAKTTSSLAEKFNEVVQVDLLFVEEHVVLHLIDESIRWTTTALLADRQAATLIETITNVWLRIFGPMQCLVSDQEGGLAGEESATWAERWKVSLSRLDSKRKVNTQLWSKDTTPYCGMLYTGYLRKHAVKSSWLTSKTSCQKQPTLRT